MMSASTKDLPPSDAAMSKKNPSAEQREDELCDQGIHDCGKSAQDAISAVVEIVEGLKREVTSLNASMRATKRMKSAGDSTENAVPDSAGVRVDLVQPTLVRMGVSLDVLRAHVVDVKEDVVYLRRTVTQLSACVDSLCFAVEECLRTKEEKHPWKR